MKALLTVRDLTLGYQGHAILSRVSFTALAGGFISIIGPNGSGKTTLIKAIANMNPCLDGEIRVLGQDIRAMSSRDLAQSLAVVRQGIDPTSMTVADYVVLGRLPFFRPWQFMETAKDTALARHYMALTGIDHLEGARLDEISGGERQLAAIARALTQEPKILVMDEPTSHLDIAHQIRVLELVSRLKTDLGLAVVMVLHDLNLASEFSDHLILLNKDKGEVHAQGSSASVLTETAVQAVYHTRVKIRENPESQKPCLFLVRSETRLTSGQAAGSR